MPAWGIALGNRLPNILALKARVSSTPLGHNPNDDRTGDEK
jgi:hypothetical protein